MKQVPSHHYSQDYFETMFVSPDFNKKPTLKSFSRKYQEISSLLKLKDSDHIVDFACGNGDLSFYLSLLTNPTITAIDYSKDAIAIANSKLKSFNKIHPKHKISFINAPNNKLPKLKNIKAIYLADVVEHLYPHETSFLLNRFKDWGSPYLLIHTDSSHYQFFIRPFLNLFQLIIKPSSFTQLKRDFLMDKQMHVNLTNPSKLKRLLQKQGYQHIKTLYPAINSTTIKNQLGPLSKIPFLISFLNLILPKLTHFLPSFYSLFYFPPKTSRSPVSSL